MAWPVRVAQLYETDYTSLWWAWWFESAAVCLEHWRMINQGSDAVIIALLDPTVFPDLDGHELARLLTVVCQDDSDIYDIQLARLYDRYARRLPGAADAPITGRAAWDE